jgi:hypothetical protein
LIFYPSGSEASFARKTVNLSRISQDSVSSKFVAVLLRLVQIDVDELPKTCQRSRSDRRFSHVMIFTAFPSTGRGPRSKLGTATSLFVVVFGDDHFGYADTKSEGRSFDRSHNDLEHCLLKGEPQEQATEDGPTAPATASTKLPRLCSFTVLPTAMPPRMPPITGGTNPVNVVPDIGLPKCEGDG